MLNLFQHLTEHKVDPETLKQVQRKQVQGDKTLFVFQKLQKTLTCHAVPNLCHAVPNFCHAELVSASSFQHLSYYTIDAKDPELN